MDTSNVEPSPVGARLQEAVGLWLVAPPFGTEEVVRASCDALVQGVDTPALRELAAEPFNASHYAFRDLVERTVAELGWTLPADPDAAVLATKMMCRKMLRGELSRRELARWAHMTIGHGGPPQVQPLVDLDDAYDQIDVIGATAAELDRDVDDEAAKIIRLESVR